MNRELLKAEIKSTAYHRRIVKARARSLFREAQAKYEDSYDRYISMADTAVRLQHSRASYARSLNIASGLMRGISYKRIEAKCNEAPDAKEIHGIILSHVGWRERKDWTLERVRSLLA